jgi:hypothetical protein
LGNFAFTNFLPLTIRTSRGSLLLQAIVNRNAKVTASPILEGLVLSWLKWRRR